MLPLHLTLRLEGAHQVLSTPYVHQLCLVFPLFNRSFSAPGLFYEDPCSAFYSVPLSYLYSVLVFKP